MAQTPILNSSITKEANANGGFNFFQSVNVSKTNVQPNEPIRLPFPTPRDGDTSWRWDSTKPEPNRSIALVLPGDSYCGLFQGVDIWWVSEGTTEGFFKSGSMSGQPDPGLDTLTLTVFAV